MIPVGAIGVSDIVTVDGAAATAAVSFRPTEHEIWIVHHLYIYHDDPAGLNTYYYMYDGANTHSLADPDLPLAVSTNKYLFTKSDVAKPLVVTYSHYPRFNFTGIAAGKKGYIRAFVTKLRGLPTDYGT